MRNPLSSQNRIAWIDYAKGISILLVVINRRFWHDPGENGRALDNCAIIALRTLTGQHHVNRCFSPSRAATGHRLVQAAGNGL
jgi:hypothetical protein